MMRVKIYNTLLLLLAAFCWVACNEDLPVENPQQGAGQVTVTMSLGMPATAVTRAMDGNEAPAITSLYLVVFDDNHFLKQVVQATPADATGTELAAFTPVDESGLKVTYFNVTLDIAEKLNIHLVANYDASALPFGSEGQVMGTLVTSGEQDVYWQRVENVNIPAPQTTEEKATNTIMAVTRVPKLVRVPLVRNYAKLTVQNSSQGNFLLTGIALSNLADCGTVAPRISENKFADYVATDGGGNKTCKSYSEILAQGYQGNEAGTQLLTDLTWADSPDNPFFVYEHKNVDAEKTVFLIVKGVYDPDGLFYQDAGNTELKAETFYKLDLIYKDGDVTKYYNIIRNLWYKVVIKGVASSGYTTVEEAISKPATNNLSASTAIADLTNISDGDRHLFVDRTSIVIVRDGDVHFKFRYIPDLKNAPGTPGNNQVTLSTGAGNVISGSPSIAASDENGWRRVTISHKEPGPSVETQTVTVSAGGLERTVTLTLRKPYDMLVRCNGEENPTLYKTYNQPVRVSLYIPKNIPRPFFPLYFNIGADNNSLYPQANTQMPTVINNDGTYAFQKELRLVDYSHLPSETVNGVEYLRLDCDFMTNTNAAGQTTVKVTNPYFNEGTGRYNQANTAVLDRVSIEGTEYYGPRQEVTLKYTLLNAVAEGNLKITLREDVTNDDGTVTRREKSAAIAAADRTAGTEHKITMETQSFNGIISFVIEATYGANTQTTQVYNPKKRHILYIPEGSFRFDQRLFPADRWRTENRNEPGTGYDKALAAGYEWPDLIIDGEDCGGGPMTFDGGTQGNRMVEIDATYGERDRQFRESSVVEFVTYYNYYDENGGTDYTQHPAKVFKTTLGAISNEYAEKGHLRDFILWWGEDDTDEQNWEWKAE